MKKLILPLLVMASLTGCAQQNNSTGGGLFKKASDIQNKSKGGGLSTDEIVAGLKEAFPSEHRTAPQNYRQWMVFLPMQPLKYLCRRKQKRLNRH